jgi:hypothetical protein
VGRRGADDATPSFLLSLPHQRLRSAPHQIRRQRGSPSSSSPLHTQLLPTPCLCPRDPLPNTRATPPTTRLRFYKQPRPPLCAWLLPDLRPPHACLSFPPRLAPMGARHRALCAALLALALGTSAAVAARTGACQPAARARVCGIAPCVAFPFERAKHAYALCLLFSPLDRISSFRPPPDARAPHPHGTPLRGIPRALSTSRALARQKKLTTPPPPPSPLQTQTNNHSQQPTAPLPSRPPTTDPAASPAPRPSRAPTPTGRAAPASA